MTDTTTPEDRDAVAGPLQRTVGRPAPECEDDDALTFVEHRDRTAEDIDAVVAQLTALAARVRDGDLAAFERWWFEGGTEEGDATVFRIRELLMLRYSWRQERSAEQHNGPVEPAPKGSARTGG